MERHVSYKRILVPVQGNECDRRAIELATVIANGSGAEIALVYVVEVAQKLPLEAELPNEIERAEHALALSENWATRTGASKGTRVYPELLQARAAGPAIVDEAVERGVDLIVMALRAHKRHGRPVVGETVPYVLKNSPCEVVVTRSANSAGFDACEWLPVEAAVR